MFFLNNFKVYLTYTSLKPTGQGFDPNGIKVTLD